jgi:hypothetical protein
LQYYCCEAIRSSLIKSHLDGTLGPGMLLYPIYYIEMDIDLEH